MADSHHDAALNNAASAPHQVRELNCTIGRWRDSDTFNGHKPTQAPE